MLICECCGEKEATHWMDQGVWLCDECANQYIEENPD